MGDFFWNGDKSVRLMNQVKISVSSTSHGLLRVTGR